MSGELANALAAALSDVLGDVQVTHLQRLSAGASRETWSFTAVSSDETQQMILQRHRSAASEFRTGLDEAALLRCARTGGVSVPQILASDTGEANPTGAPFTLSRRIEGESIPRKILRDDAFADARQSLVADFGRELAAIHRLETTSLDQIATIDDPLTVQRTLYEAFEDPHPVFDLAFRWLAERRPRARQTSVVHGDFRMGNLLVDSSGLAAVLDWELAHLGDPAFDLGWLVARAWRFGGEGEVGGLGTRIELLDAYQAGGGEAVTLEELRWWEMLACLRWGVVTMAMVADHRAGSKGSMEHAVIGRRVVETEYDVMLLLGPQLLGRALA